MKLIILTILVAFPSVLFAGAPEEDAAVVLVRHKFVSAKTPAEKDLKLGRKWKCLSLYVMPGYFQTSESVISFSRFNGFIQPTSWEVDGNSKLDSDRQYMGVMTSMPAGLIGHCNQLNCVSTFLLRIASDELIIENSVPTKANPDFSTWYPTTAIIDAGSRAVSYSICPMDQILKP